ncbi:hypothetical protein M378DRAFT_171278 [Amanita muscaria Koide BX008]|uniref:Uncharacterized protein n=1 Tax=Amanita muscaria (strain Koide BX008) TaxID=946122 RepID=A0A0C2WNK9_AMAMK|nr:hypothetical protein M378DRAFT_171278 [Amanita muscaria Koide BX008]
MNLRALRSLVITGMLMNLSSANVVYQRSTTTNVRYDILATESFKNPTIHSTALALELMSNVLRSQCV